MRGLTEKGRGGTEKEIEKKAQGGRDQCLGTRVAEKKEEKRDGRWARPGFYKGT